MLVADDAGDTRSVSHSIFTSFFFAFLLNSLPTQFNFDTGFSLHALFLIQTVVSLACTNSRRKLANFKETHGISLINATFRTNLIDQIAIFFNFLYFFLLNLSKKKMFLSFNIQSILILHDFIWNFSHSDLKFLIQLN